MRYLTDSHTMKSVDACSIQEFGIPSVVLMERAALGVSAFLRKIIAENTRQESSIKVVCVCGSGNNGADGIAVSRQLNENGIYADIVLAGTSAGTDEYRLQKSIAEKLGIHCDEYDSNTDFGEYDYIVDAIFGIGLSRKIEGRYAQIIQAVNNARDKGTSKVVAVDIASGISADNGQIQGVAVRADYTVTFGYNKTGIMFYPGASYSGSVEVINAGFVTDDILHSKVEGFGSIFTYDDKDAGRLLVRKPDSNKGTYGRTLIIAGSKNMGGAAILSASAAYRSGTGLVKVLTHEVNKTALLCRMPECLISTYLDNMPLAAELKADFEWAKSIAVGPGLSMNVAAAEITRCVLERDDKVRILDADALNIIAGEHIDYKGSREGQIIITPHIMEMSRLTGKTVADIKEHMIESAKEYAIQHSCICILKDARTVVTDGQKVYINCTGNDGMSTGGCGDVLTGLIAGMTAMGLDAFEAACLSVYVHGKAGDYAASGKGRAGMTAADISEAIAYVLKR